MNQAKYFIKDYKVPLSATAVFVLVVLALFLLRNYDRSVLAESLSGEGSGGKDYATLLSKDKADGFNKKNLTAEEKTDLTNPSPTAASQRPSTSPSFTVTGPSQSTTTPPAGSTPSATTTPPPTSGDSPPTASFTADVTGLREDGASPVECKVSTIPTSSQCVRRYHFTAEVEAYNGPGTVAYEWRISVPGSSTGSFSAGSGESLTLLNKVVVISCSTPSGPFKIQLGVTNPNQSKSNDLEVMHDCGDIKVP